MIEIKLSQGAKPGHGGILDRIDGILVGLPFGIIISFYLN